jgi:hypothetical protein
LSEFKLCCGFEVIGVDSYDSELVEIAPAVVGGSGTGFGGGDFGEIEDGSKVSVEIGSGVSSGTTSI